MPGPPDDVPPADLFLKLQEARPSDVIDFPRKTGDGKRVGTTRIQVLLSSAHDKARIQALIKLRKTQGLTKEDIEGPYGATLLGDGTARELLAMACLTENPIAGSDGENPRYAQVFRDAEAIGDNLTSDEVAVLFQAYLLIQAKYGPFEKTVQTEQELSEWIKRLTEGAAAFPLQQLSSVHWAELASLLAVRAYTLSAILECLLPSLPPSLVSRLETYSLGTGFFGRRAAGTSADGTETSPSRWGVPDVTLTVEDAKAVAERAKAAEEQMLAELDEADRNRDI